jgi:hypothetical protein
MFRYHRVWSLLQPQRPRHPIVSALLGLFAVCAIAVLLLVGLVVGAIVFVGSLVWRALHPHAAAERTHPDSPVVDDDVIDGEVINGEFRVLRRPLNRITNH